MILESFTLFLLLSQIPDFCGCGLIPVPIYLRRKNLSQVVPMVDDNDDHHIADLELEEGVTKVQIESPTNRELQLNDIEKSCEENTIADSPRQPEMTEIPGHNNADTNLNTP